MTNLDAVILTWIIVSCVKGTFSEKPAEETHSQTIAPSAMFNINQDSFLWFTCRHLLELGQGNLAELKFQIVRQLIPVMEDPCRVPSSENQQFLTGIEPTFSSKQLPDVTVREICPYHISRTYSFRVLKPFS